MQQSHTKRASSIIAKSIFLIAACIYCITCRISRFILAMWWHAWKRAVNWVPSLFPCVTDMFVYSPKPITNELPIEAVIIFSHFCLLTVNYTMIEKFVFHSSRRFACMLHEQVMTYTLTSFTSLCLDIISSVNYLHVWKMPNSMVSNIGNKTRYENTNRALWKLWPTVQHGICVNTSVGCLVHTLRLLQHRGMAKIMWHQGLARLLWHGGLCGYSGLKSRPTCRVTLVAHIYYFFGNTFYISFQDTKHRITYKYEHNVSCGACAFCKHRIHHACHFRYVFK